MLTFEKVLDVFKDYLAKDKSHEVLSTSRGCLVVNWENCEHDWVTAQLCPAPEDLRDVLRFGYVERQSFFLTDGYMRDLAEQEEQDIERMGLGLAARCEEK